MIVTFLYTVAVVALLMCSHAGLIDDRNRHFFNVTSMADALAVWVQNLWRAGKFASLALLIKHVKGRLLNN